MKKKIFSILVFLACAIVLTIPALAVETEVDPATCNHCWIYLADGSRVMSCNDDGHRIEYFRVRVCDVCDKLEDQVLRTDIASHAGREYCSTCGWMKGVSVNNVNNHDHK